ncbi:unnamed protein product, partial [Mesorhabditis spiculigera]
MPPKAPASSRKKTKPEKPSKHEESEESSEAETDISSDSDFEPPSKKPKAKVEDSDTDEEVVELANKKPKKPKKKKAPTKAKGQLKIPNPQRWTTCSSSRRRSTNSPGARQTSRTHPRRALVIILCQACAIARPEPVTFDGETTVLTVRLCPTCSKANRSVGYTNFSEIQMKDHYDNGEYLITKKCLPQKLEKNFCDRTGKISAMFLRGSLHIPDLNNAALQTKLKNYHPRLSLNGMLIQRCPEQLARRRRRQNPKDGADLLHVMQGNRIGLTWDHYFIEILSLIQ